MSTNDAWNVDQYDKFKNERSQPFFDLMDLVQPRPGMTALDLGCGTGALTKIFHEKFQAHETVGIDNSPNMLDQAPQATGLRFELANAQTYQPQKPTDLILSNALIHWIPDHAAFFERLRSSLNPGGQLAFQFPNNGSHPYQQTAYALEPDFPDYPPNTIDANILAPEDYAVLLDRLGYTDIYVALRVYVHHLERGDKVLEWAKGTFLTHYARVMPPEIHEKFMDRYREALFQVIDPAAPYTFTFKRIFLSAIRT